MDAIALQDSDSVKGVSGLNDSRGVMSGALWESLKTACMHLQRVDLVTLCDQQDLEGTRVLLLLGTSQLKLTLLRRIPPSLPLLGE